MNVERWHQVDKIFQAVLGREPHERALFLDRACAGDPSLREEVEALIRSDEGASSFLKSPAVHSLSAPDSLPSGSLNGKVFGPYELKTLLGAGGMGEVYRAKDSKLKRDVAIKVLPYEFSRDAERLARFQREAEVQASLNHPHIAAIYDLATFGEMRLLVLELVEGETLADRLSLGPIPIDAALHIAKQIAEALEAAHEKGIIHRDLKPANIKITPDGHVKVLDFGLAKVLAEGTDLWNAATKMTSLAPGGFLGTAAYMSPEQAKGKEADRTSDVWAFGCVFYEMLTGRAVFAGETVGEILEGVFKSEPDWGRLPAGTPEGVRRLLRRCLQKDHKLRFRDIRDARLEIEDVQAAPPNDRRTEPIYRRRGQRAALAGTLALVTLIAVVTGVRTFRTVIPEEPERRFEINMPSIKDAIRDESALAAISPDGLKIVFAATMAGESQLWLRSLDSVSARPLAGTERAEMPFWSPDNRSVGFFADGDLKRVDLDGGSLQTLAHAEAGAGGAWSRTGTIIFSPNPGRPILQIPARRAEPTAVTPFEAPQQASQSFPQFLPDSRHFLYFVTGSPEASGVYVGQIDGLTTHRLLDADAPAVFTPTGHLLFMRQGNLMAQAFDADRLELTGNTFPVAEHLGRWAALSASAAGPIVYRIPPAGGGQQQFVWVDRSGKETDSVVYPNTGGLGASLSRDGRAIAMFKYTDGNMDIWSFEIERRVWNRITADSADDIFPVWALNRRSIVFGSNRKQGGIQNLYRKSVDGAPGSEELLFESPQIKFATDWSPKGNFLLYDSINREKGGSEIWALPLEGDRKPFEVVHTVFKEQAGQFSPDGNWIAYQSDRDGRFQIYVQAFPGPAESVLVSINGGTQVRWNPNGKELFYIAPDGPLMTVPIRIASIGQALVPGAATALFATKLRPNKRQQYMVSSDGRSFVMNSIVETTVASPVTVILNWKPKP